MMAALWDGYLHGVCYHVQHHWVRSTSWASLVSFTSWAPLWDGDPEIVVLSPVQVGEEVGEGKEGLLLLLPRSCLKLDISSVTCGLGKPTCVLGDVTFHIVCWLGKSFPSKPCLGSRAHQKCSHRGLWQIWDTTEEGALEEHSHTLLWNHSPHFSSLSFCLSMPDHGLQNFTWRILLSCKGQLCRKGLVWKASGQETSQSWDRQTALTAFKGWFSRRCHFLRKRLALKKYIGFWNDKVFESTFS